MSFAELAAEVSAIESALAASPRLPAGWRREPFAWENVALFQAAEEEVGRIARQLAGELAELRAQQLQALSEALRQAAGENPAHAARLLLRIEANGLVEVPALSAATEGRLGAIARRLEESLMAGALSTVEEARAQGTAAELRLPSTARLADDLDVAARRVAYGSTRDLVAALREEALRETTAQSAGRFVSRVLGAGRNLSDARLEDYAATAVSNTYGRGRLEEALALGRPRRIYASELLDRNTCSPCASVDGREYPTIDAARTDYPDGYYRDCEGGLRCRGTLVFVWDEEPTGDTPPPPPPPSPEPEPSPGPARSWESKDEAEEYLRDRFAANYSTEEVEAVAYYRGSGFGSLNHYHRGLDDPTDRKRRLLDAMTEELDDLAARTATPEPITVYRGVRREFVEGLGADGELAGLEWIDNGYVSTSAAGEVARLYGAEGVLRIRVPAGTPAIAPDALSPGLREAEVILGRGLRYRIVGRNPDGTWETEVLRG